MKILLFGATGTIGQAVLRECLAASDVTGVTAVQRTPTGQHDPRLAELLHRDFFDLTPLSRELADHDACFFCLGVSAASLTERDYRRITHDLTLAAANLLVAVNPAMTFIHVSGSGADGDQEGRVPRARIQGDTETAILRLPFRAAYVLRPGTVEPRRHDASRTRLARLLHAIAAAIHPRPRISAAEVGRAMLTVARRGFDERVLDTRDIRRAART